MSRSQAFDAVQQLRQDLLGESKVDPGLLVRMQVQLDDYGKRQARIESNPVVWLGWNLHYAAAVVAGLVVAIGGYFFKDKLGL